MVKLNRFLHPTLRLKWLTRMREYYKLCICGEFLSKELFNVQDHANDLYKAFYVDIKGDNSLIHPNNYCQCCNASVNNIIQRKTTSKLEVKKWAPHNKDCEVCTKKKKVGRKPKKKSTGRVSCLNNDIWTRAQTVINLNDLIYSKLKITAVI